MLLVESTPLAAQQARGMRGRAAKAFDTFCHDLEHRGCAAMRYRLTGSGYETLCAQHVHGPWRVLVVFPEPRADLAVIVLVGQHDDRSPESVYDLLYQLVGHEPEPGAGRTKPSCCDEESGEPPVADQDLVETLSQRISQLRQSLSPPGGRRPRVVASL